MKILVIGGTGNISRWFVRQFLEKGYDVSLYNRGYHQVAFDQPVKIIVGDRTDHRFFEGQIKSLPMFDCVIDMVGYEPTDAHSAVRAFMGRTGQYIFCSTVDVFSKHPHAYPITEQHALGALPSFPYAFKKMQMENIFEQAYKEDQFPLTILRPAATYSEGWSPLVTCFGGQSYHLDRIRRGMPVILHGEGNAIWVAAHSEDISRAFVNAVGNSHTVGKSFNVAGEELLTWRRMHEVVAEELKAPLPDFIYIPTKILSKLAPKETEWCVENFQYNNIYDTKLAKDVLQYQYTITYREGVRRCLKALEQNNEIEKAEKYPFYDDVILKWSNLMQQLY
jgi:nucleoside-diphosphate-sugar epimerase